MQGNGLVDGIIPEPLGGAHLNPTLAIDIVKNVILETINELQNISPIERINQRVEREAQTLDQLALRLSHALPNPDRMREQIQGWQQRLNQAWLVRIEAWKRNQGHYQSQLEMLNPQRTLERGYAVILSTEAQVMQAVRNPNELNTKEAFQVRLAEGQLEVEFSKLKIDQPA
jgi:exodeoxyribonuclease VII large subunit